MSFSNSIRKKSSANLINRNENSSPGYTGSLIVNVSAAFGFRAPKGKTIDFKVLLRCTNEKFNVYKFPVNMKISDLKSLLEFVCGIPYNLQRLSYLDDGELVDNKELQYFDIIDGALINMDIWTIYVGLVQAAVRGDFDNALTQGVSNRVEWKSPTYDYMYTMHKSKYITERGGIALFIASHRGNIGLVKGLISHGANINYQSSYGRTPIMVSVVANKTDIIDYLLSHDADIDLTDVNGDTPLTISKKFNNKLGTHKLAQFKWKKRTEAEIKNKKSIANKDEPPIFNETRLPHQIFDSSKKTWIKGDFGAMYMMQLVPETEYSGGKLSAPKSVGKEVLRKHLLSRSSTEVKLRFVNNSNEEEDIGEIMPIENGLSYEKWLEQKKRAKKLQEEKKKKKELEHQASIEKKDENVKENKHSAITKDENNWMKDYSKSTHSLSKLDKDTSLLLQDLSNPIASNSSIESSTNRFKSLEMLNIYKGMSYDEWCKVRDKFLETHNMS